MKNAKISFEEIKNFKNIGELKSRVQDINNYNNSLFLSIQSDNNITKILRDLK